MKEFSDLVIILTIKERACLRSRTMAAICARILAPEALRTLGLTRIFGFTTEFE